MINICGSRLLVPFLFLLGGGLSVGKVTRGTFSVSPEGDGVLYISQFGCAVGVCSFRARARRGHRGNGGRHASSLKLQVFLDEEWDGVPVSRRPRCNLMSLARSQSTLFLPSDGYWSDWVSGSLEQRIRPHVWYFVLEDCGREVTAPIDRNSPYAGPSTVDWELELTQSDGSQFPYELLSSMKTSIFHLVSFGAVLIFMVAREFRELKRGYYLNRMVQLLNAIVMVQMASCLLQLAHLVRYSSNGVGFPFLSRCNDALNLITQIALSTLLVLIAAGHTLNISNRRMEQSDSSTTTATFSFGSHQSAFEFAAAPALVAVGALHLIFFFIDSLTLDPRFRFHSAGLFLGLLIALLRLALWGVFIFQCHLTIQQTASSPSLVGFLRRFRFVGSLYLLAYPLVFCSTCFFAPYLQHKVISNGTFLMQLFSLMWLSALFLTKGQYFKVSELSQSYLPGSILSPKGRRRMD